MRENKKEESRKESSICGNAIKGTAKGVEESRERGDSTCGQAMRSIARGLEKESSAHPTMESIGAL